MKIKITSLSILILNLFLIEQTTAQVILTPKNDTLNRDKNSDLNLMLDLKKGFKPLFENKILLNGLNNSAKAKLFSSNPKFDIYNLPLDNMPCIVPNKMFRGNMNTMEQTFNNASGQGFSNIIPNLFKRKVLIPGKNLLGR